MQKFFLKPLEHSDITFVNYFNFSKIILLFKPMPNISI